MAAGKQKVVRPTKPYLTRPGGAALVAAARRHPQLTSAALRKLKDRPDHRNPDAWQVEAYDAVERIGPLHYVLNMKAKTVARGTLKIVEEKIEDEPVDAITAEVIEERGGESLLNADPKLEQRPTLRREPMELLNRLRGPQGGTKELLRKAALHLEIGGESYLFGQIADAGTLEWEFLSPLELRPQGGGRYTRRLDGGGRTEEADADAYVARMWESDPRFTGLPDCPLRAALPLIRQVIALDDLITAATQSKLAAPLLILPADDEEVSGPSDVEFSSADGGNNEGTGDGQGDQFLDALFEHMRAPIEDPTSGSRWVPIVIRLDPEDASMVRVVDLGRNIDTFAQGLREEAYGRLARALDVPPEMMEGKSGLSHWSSYNVDSSFIQEHVLPLGEKIAEFLTHSYLRPLLMLSQAEGGYGWSAEEAERYSIYYDPSKLLSRQDGATTARVLYEMGLLSDDSTRRANGFDETDAPSHPERLRRFLERVFPASPYQVAPLLFPMYGLEPPGAAPWDPSPWTPEDNSQAKKIANDIAREVPDSTTKVPKPATKVTDRVSSGSDEPDRRIRNRPGQSSVLTERLAVSAHAALERCLERAGNRVVSAANRHEVLRARLAGVPTVEVVSMLNPAELNHIGVDPRRLVEDEFAGFRRDARRWIADAFGSAPGAADRASLAADTLAAALTEVAVAGLRAPLPWQDNGLRVPNELIEAALAEHGLMVAA